jgi:hypothetical protein
MRKLGILILSLLSINVYANSHRVTQIANNKVHVWETTIEPSSAHKIKMHHHNFDRVVVALDNGTLKIVNDHGKVHYLKLQKDKSYYLKKDVGRELHTDENMGRHPIKVIVVELSSPDH